VKGNAVADFDLVTLRHPETQEELEVPKGALPFFENQGYEVQDKKGRRSASADKEN
jgi:hypothetical protein